MRLTALRSHRLSKLTSYQVVVERLLGMALLLVAAYFTRRALLWL